MRAIISVLTAMLLVGAAQAQQAETDALEQGRTLVTTYCADCHATEAADDSPHPEAPPFRELGQRYDVEWLSEGLVEGLVSGHPDMPEFEFDPQQAEAIVSYLKSLQS